MATNSPKEKDSSRSSVRDSLQRKWRAFWSNENFKQNTRAILLGSTSCDVEKWRRECLARGVRKGPKTRTKGHLQRYDVGTPFERMALDILGPFPETTKGN
ncbi:hypothetical protein AVEN_30292-1 [Araneus ventricosus]|uniref:Uncharacterized protein n=1 Tax=Araneus ventricosus TaxID=182803 RepID=A0A4Y2V808_ARAVE|nr:hypothetical protein AVEN_30292-1 [Araneus ventricosus]